MENLGGWDQTQDHPDFDPNLLNVESWGVDQNAEDVEHDNNDSGTTRLHSWKKSNTSSEGLGDSLNVDHLSTLGVTEFEQQEDAINKQNGSTISNSALRINNADKTIHLQPTSGVEGLPNETVEAAVEAAVAAISVTSDSVNSGDRSSRNNTYNNISQHLHPLGIQSSASCPAPVHANASTFQQPHQVQQQSQQQHQQRESSTVAIPEATATSTISNAPSAAQHISSLTANFMLAQAANSTVAATAAAAAAAAAAAVNQEHQQQHNVSVISQPSIIPNDSASNKTKPKTGKAASGRQRNSGARQQKDSSKSRKKKTNAAATSDTNDPPVAPTSGLPPFYLFDAPIELRANFMQNQRRLGLPIQHDPNSYHYGETVNGFHPHQYQLPFGVNASNAAAGVAGAGVPPSVRPSPPPQLIDARHGNYRKNKGGQVKNEREQKRAQKITELIEQLRLQMEKGGWQVEARSKFHTLSNCGQYIKHMIKLTSDKENENQKLNVELDEKRRKLEREKEEKAMQEGRSDPESVTSSLTSDTTMSTARHKQEEETSGESAGDDNKKRKLPNSGNSTGDDSNNNSDGKVTNKKHRITSSEVTTEDSSGDDNRGGSGTGSGSGNSRTGSGTGSGSGGSGSGSGGISKTISSISELTDSNRGSSSNNSGSGGGSSDDVPTEQDSRESTSGNREDITDQPSTSSISSDAAVASEKTSRDRNTGHKDVVFNNDKRMSRKRPPDEVTSLERTFELNYEEVFNKSNIPQLIASTSGKIVTWNECFCKATGYRKSEIERMTIFSLVKPENLANFFEIVAAALRPDDEEIAKENKENGDSSDVHSKKGTEDDFSTRTTCSGEVEALKQNTTSSQDSISGRDTVVCSNNEKNCGEQAMVQDKIDAHAVPEKQEKESLTKSEEEGDKMVEEDGTHKIETDNRSGNSLNEENISDSKEEERKNEVDTKDVSGNSINEETSTSSMDKDGANKTETDNISGNSKNEETSSNSIENDLGTSSQESSKESQNNDTNVGDTAKEKADPEKDEKGSNLPKKEGYELISNRLLNYRAMTLPCIDFPAMKKRNQESSVTIPPLHVTVTLMSDKDPRRRCFHCVFTNSKGTNGSLGIITPELLASLFATPLRTSRRHQRKRSRGGTTRVGQSVSTSTANNKEQKHCVQHIVSTSEQHENPPSPLLMPPPGPPIEESSKKEGESKTIKIEMTD